MRLSAVELYEYTRDPRHQADIDSEAKDMIDEPEAQEGPETDGADEENSSGSSRNRPEGALRLRKVQAKYEKANGIENPKRSENAKMKLGMEVLEAIAKGEVRQAQKYAAAALGKDAPERERTPEQAERRAKRVEERKAAGEERTAGRRRREDAQRPERDRANRERTPEQLERQAQRREARKGTTTEADAASATATEEKKD